MGLSGGLIAVDVVVEQLHGFVQGEPRAGQGGFEEFEGLAERELRLVGTEFQAERSHEQVGHRYQAHVVMPTGPGAGFVIRHADFSLGLLPPFYAAVLIFNLWLVVVGVLGRSPSQR